VILDPGSNTATKEEGEKTFVLPFFATDIKNCKLFIFEQAKKN
jgi:hypothetical protein